MTGPQHAVGAGGRRPVAPNAAQKALLRRLCAVVAQARAQLDIARIDWEAGMLAEPSWFARLDTLIARGAALEELGHAGGIPQRWIDFARTRGEQGLGWRTPQRWPVPNRVPRAELIDELAAEARALDEVVAVHAAYRNHGLENEPEHLRTRIAITAALWHERIAAVAAMLDLIGPERDRISPAPLPVWAQALAATVRDRDPGALAHHWRTHAEHEPASVAGYRLLTDQGDIDFAPDSAIAPIPAVMVEHITAVLRVPPGLADHDLYLGAATENAVTAALGPTCFHSGVSFPDGESTRTPGYDAATARTHRDSGPSP